MVLFNIPDIFQKRISEIFDWFDIVCAYIDSVLVLTKHKFLDHLKVPANIYIGNRRSGVKVKCVKPLFGCTETEKLHFWVSKTCQETYRPK